MSSTGSGQQRLGNKRVCSSCSAKVYDFNKSDATCPKCEFDDDREDEA